MLYVAVSRHDFSLITTAVPNEWGGGGMALVVEVVPLRHQLAAFIEGIRSARAGGRTK